MEALQKKIADAKAKGQKDLAAQLQQQLDQIQPNLIASINEQLKNYSDADAIAQQRTQGFAGSLHYLQSSAEGAQISLGEPLLQPMAKLLRMLGDIVNQVTAWGQANPKLVEVAGTLGMLAVAFAT